MTGSATTANPAEVGQATRELVDIVTRAQRLGFCRWRVATALGAHRTNSRSASTSPAAHDPDIRSSSTSLSSSRTSTARLH